MRAITRTLLPVIILAALLISSASALTLEEQYDIEFNKLKISRDYVYRDGNTIQWQIINYDPAYNYYLRIYAPGHTSIIQEYIIKDSTGQISFNYPGLSPVHINLQKQIPEGKENEYCKSYPCKISENLDIITINPVSKIQPTDLYTLKLRYWTRAPFDTINGASWQSAINIDKEVK